MGKYMKKAKEKGEVAVMEVVQPSSVGAGTRAKNLALKSQQRAAVEDGGGSYLELRNRRLEKPAALLDNKRKKHPSSKESNSKRICLKIEGKEDTKEKNFQENLETNESNEAGHITRANEFLGRERITRESTPCNLTTSPDNTETPASSTKPPCEAHSGLHNPMLIPTAREMDEFFSSQEEQQCKNFMEKYNFDPMNEKPLPGNFEWVKVVL